MRQLDFLSALEPPPFALARSTNPSTSHAAAARVKEFTRGHQEEILDALRRFGPMTVDQIAARTNLQSQQINKRTPELQRASLIRLTGLERLSASGRLERVWEAV